MDASFPLAQQIGHQLREERRRQGLRQEDLAFAAGLSRPAIVNVEQGRTGVRWGTVLQTIEALGLELDLTPRGAPRG